MVCLHLQHLLSAVLTLLILLESVEILHFWSSKTFHHIFVFFWFHFLSSKVFSWVIPQKCFISWEFVTFVNTLCSKVLILTALFTGIVIIVFTILIACKMVMLMGKCFFIVSLTVFAVLLAKQTFYTSYMLFIIVPSKHNIIC